jgi:hypothetical protein
MSGAIPLGPPPNLDNYVEEDLTNAVIIEEKNIYRENYFF